MPDKPQQQTDKQPTLAEAYERLVFAPRLHRAIREWRLNGKPRKR